MALTDTISSSRAKRHAGDAPSQTPKKSVRKPVAAKDRVQVSGDQNALTIGGLGIIGHLESFDHHHVVRPSGQGFVTLYHAPTLTQVGWVKNGIGARDADLILGQLRFPKGAALNALQIPVATMNRKIRDNAQLSPAEGERVLGVGRLLGQLQAMVQESGNPEGFDAAAWLSEWLSSPVPALGGTRPLDLMDTMTGQALVSQTLAQMQSGAYA
jgi:putative toxin-antitoxin system antitoxin component (TIGR02293 family)